MQIVERERSPGFCGGTATVGRSRKEQEAQKNKKIKFLLWYKA